MGRLHDVSPCHVTWGSQTWTVRQLPVANGEEPERIAAVLEADVAVDR